MKTFITVVFGLIISFLLVAGGMLLGQAIEREASIDSCVQEFALEGSELSYFDIELISVDKEKKEVAIKVHPMSTEGKELVDYDGVVIFGGSLTGESYFGDGTFFLPGDYSFSDEGMNLFMIPFPEEADVFYLAVWAKKDSRIGGNIELRF